MKIYPVNPFSGSFPSSPDKSATLRALLLSALTENEKTIYKPLIAADTLSMIDCLRALGAKIDVGDGVIKVLPAREVKNGAELNVGNSATTLRLLLGALAGLDVSAVFVGDESLSSRDFSNVIKPLTAAGAEIESKGGKPPISLKSGIKNDVCVATDSAQVKGGALLAGYFGNKKCFVKELAVTRGVTEKELARGGANITRKGDKIILDGGKKSFEEFSVGGDPSSAAYFVALGVLLGKTTVKGVALERGRDGFFNVLKKMGARLIMKEREDGSYDVTALRSKLSAVETDEREASSFIDEAPLLALCAAFADGTTRINGLRGLKNKECDRLSETARLITLAGGKVVAGEDYLEVEGAPLKGGFSYYSNDHRMTMTATVCMTASLCGGEIENPASVEVSFPNFFKLLSENSFALVGEDTRGSLSFLAHSPILSSRLSSYAYSCLSLSPLEAEELLKKSPYKAINVTNPYKTTAWQILRDTGKITPTTKSVNFISGGKGYNTDVVGLVLALSEEDYSFNGKAVLVYGSGGVARSVCEAFHALGTTVYAKARNPLKTKKMMGELPFVLQYSGEKVEVLANASSLGRPFAVGAPFLKEEVASAEYVFDVNYEPIKTELLRFADELKIKNSGGLKMLFYQALVADGIYLDKELEKASFKEYYKEFLKDYEDFTR